MAENQTLETLNIESNQLTNESLEPLFELLETHVTIREFKCAHQKAGLGSRGEEAMARAAGVQGLVGPLRVFCHLPPIGQSTSTTCCFSSMLRYTKTIFFHVPVLTRGGAHSFLSGGLTSNVCYDNANTKLKPHDVWLQNTSNHC